MNKNIELIEKYDTEKHFECITCETWLYDEECGIDVPSYFIAIAPVNARICMKCMGDLISRGPD